EPQKAQTRVDLGKGGADRAPILYKEGFVLRLRPETLVFDDGCQLPNGGGGNQLDGSGQYSFGTVLGGFGPGRMPPIWGPGTVKKNPAGSKILLRIQHSKTH